MPNRVEVKQETASVLEEKASIFNTLFQKQEIEFNKSPDRTYYLVSCKFIKEWLDFCTAKTSSRLFPSSMNEDLVEAGSKKLKANLREKEDFSIVNENIYALFSKYAKTV